MYLLNVPLGGAAEGAIPAAIAGAVIIAAITIPIIEVSLIMALLIAHLMIAAIIRHKVTTIQAMATHREDIQHLYREIAITIANPLGLIRAILKEDMCQPDQVQMVISKERKAQTQAATHSEGNGQVDFPKAIQAHKAMLLIIQRALRIALAQQIEAVMGQAILLLKTIVNGKISLSFL